MEVSELYYEGLFKESVVQGDVREGVKGIVRAEVRGVRNVRWNGVSPDRNDLTYYSVQRTEVQWR